jgi:hypothetical protein
MDNTFSSTYAAWPLRFFGLLPGTKAARGDSAGTLAFIGQPDSTTHLYDIVEAERWLTSLDLE